MQIQTQDEIEIKSFNDTSSSFSNQFVKNDNKISKTFVKEEPRCIKNPDQYVFYENVVVKWKGPNLSNNFNGEDSFSCLWKVNNSDNMFTISTTSFIIADSDEENMKMQ